MGLTSREEDILRATIDGTEYTKPPQSRVEELLIELKEAIEQGGGGGGSTVVITPTLQSGEKIADYSINGTPGALYAPEGGGGTEVVANPEGEATDVLEKLKVGDDILDVGSDAQYRDNLIFDTNVTSDGTFTLLDSIDNYDALLISGYCAAGSNQPIVSIFVTKEEYYTQKFTLLSTVGMNTRRVFIDFPDDTHVRTDAIEGDISLRNIYGINFGGGPVKSETLVLWSGSETPTEGNPYRAELVTSFRNYDFLVVEGYEDNNRDNMPFTVPVANLKNNKFYGYEYTQSGIYFVPIDDRHIDLYLYASVNPTTYTCIRGIKCGIQKDDPFKKDLLWSGVASRADNTGHLGKPITEYPFLMMYYSDSSVAGMNEWHVELVDTSKLTDYENNTFSYEYYGTAYIRGKFVDPSNFLITVSMADAGVYPVLREIYGVDFGSGNGQNGSFQKDLLYAAPTLSGAPLRTDIPYLTDRNFFDYDLITIVQCNVIDGANNMINSPCSFTPDELYKISDGVYGLNVTGYKERYMNIIFSKHSFNIPYHAAVNESGEYSPSIYKMYGFKFGGNGGASSADAVSYNNAESGLVSNNIQDAIDEVNSIKANTDGTYDNMTVGKALAINGKGNSVVNSEPYSYRQSFSGNSAVDKLIGGTIVWNQLASLDPSSWRTYYAQVTFDGNNTILTPTTYDRSVIKYAYKAVTEGHKIMVLGNCDCTHSGSSSLYYGLFESTSGSAYQIRNAIAPGETGRIDTIYSVTTGLYFRLLLGTNATSVNYAIIENLQIIDLTKMFGSTIADYIYSLEQANTGDGVAMFKKMFPDAYYTYNEGELMSVNASARKTYDSHDTLIGDYPLDNSLTLRGIPKLDTNGIYYDGDTYESDGTVMRKYGIRAYQSGDETDGLTMITDGTDTVYALSEPTTETAIGFANPQVVDADGTEEYIDYGVESQAREVAIPVGHYTIYTPIERIELPAPDSANGIYTLKANRSINGVTYFWVTEDIYDSQERIVGEWFGKTLYQRSFDLSSITYEDQTWNHNILGTNGSAIEIVDYKGYFGLAGLDNKYPMTYVRSSNEWATLITNSDSTDLEFRPNMGSGYAIKGCSVTIKYIKISENLT